MPGLESSQPIGEPVTVSAPGHTFGLTITRKIDDTTPTTTPVIAPVVLKRRHVSASSSAGKFALAATANARPTMNETFRPEPPMTAMMIAMMPMANAAIRATSTSSCSESLRLRTIEDQMSCENAALRGEHQSGDDREDRGERDARDRGQEQVAAERALTAAQEGGEVRRGEVAAGARGFNPAFAQKGARAEPDEGGQQVEEPDDEHRPDHGRARGLGVGTVKKRIRMCGRPAVPSTSARPSDTVSSGFGR